MRQVEKMTLNEFANCISQLTEGRKLEELQRRLDECYEAINRAKAIIEADPSLTLDENYSIIKDGDRVLIGSDGKYYFLVYTQDLDVQAFSPARTLEEIKDLYKELNSEENNQ